MFFQCVGGPMDGAVYHLDKDEPNTNRKPDGLWFDGQDDTGRFVKHQYEESGKCDMTDGEIALQFIYDGTVEDVTPPDFCEHGVADGDFCDPCNRSYKAAQTDPENGVIGKAECVKCGLGAGPIVNSNEAHPGWICPACYKELNNG